MFDWALNTPLYFEIESHNIEIDTSYLNNLSEVFFKKKIQNCWNIRRRMFTAERDLSTVSLAT